MSDNVDTRRPIPGVEDGNNDEDDELCPFAAVSCLTDLNHGN